MNRLYEVLECLLLAALCCLHVNVVHSQTDILDARTNYSVDQTVTVTGIVTSDGNLGIVRYLQDETAGIALYPGGQWTQNGWPDPQPGDELTMTGALSEYNGLLEVGPDGITDVTVLSTGNELPAFQTITPNDMDESMEGELAYIPDVVFTNGGTMITGNSTFSFTAAGEDGIIYVRNDNELVGQVLPAGEVDLYGVVSQFTFDGVGGYQLLPRGNGDLATFSSTDSTSIVTFQVDMSQYTGNYGMVNLNGNFNEWCGDCAVMTDEDGDGVYVISMELNNETTYDYKFTLDGWSYQEEFEGGDYPCTSVTWDGYINRTLTVGSGATVLDAVCYNSCSICSGSDDLPWIQDCNIDNCDSWLFGNLASIVGSIWEGVDLNFECSLDGPSGPYNQWAGGVGDFTPAPVMNSTTSSNGVLIVDSDLYGAEENYSASWVENSWVQTAEPINCSATEFVRLSFQTRYRCWDNGVSDDSEKCLVEVSRDGLNWPDLATLSEEEGFVDYGTGELVPSRWEVFPDYQTGSQTENPSIINLDISPAAGGQGEAWIRFRWSGTWGFSWEIDDIIVAAIPENDLEIGYVSTTDYLNTGDLELGAVPLGQLTTHQAGVAVVNTGLADQNQISVGLSSAGQSLGASEMTTIANGTETLFQFDYSLVGLDTGMHLLEFEIQNDGSPWWDESPDDNIQAKSIEVTEYQMGRDDGVMTGSFPTDEADNFSVINPFQIYENDTVYAIDVAFAEGSALTSDLFGYLQVGQSMEDVNYAYANVVTGAGENAVGEQMLNAPGDSIIKWTTLLLDEPLAVAAGDWVGAVIESYAYPEPVRIGLAQDVYPNTCFVEGPFGSGDSWGSYYIPTAPMIRLNFDSNALASGWGCLDEASCNYNPNAFEPYLDCDTTSCAGCLDPIACNFDPSFTLSNSEYCTYPGCQDTSANNYDPEAGCEGECNYLSFDCSSIGEESWSNEAMGLFPEWQTAMHGMEWFGEWVLNIPATIIEPSSGVSYAIHHMNWMAVEGLPDWVENVTYDMGELDVSSQHCISAFGTPSEQGIYEVTATGEVYISIFGQPFSIGEQSFSAWLEVAENPNPIPGCTYPTAQNFLAFATMDDGSCEFAGCTDPEAGNFNPLATIDDGSCGEGCDPASDPSCQADNDGDGLISVSDLLILLGEFGSTCE